MRPRTDAASGQGAGPAHPPLPPGGRGDRIADGRPVRHAGPASAGHPRRGRRSSRLPLVPLRRALDARHRAGSLRRDAPRLAGHPQTVKIDVHAHYIPDFYREALHHAGHDQPDGFPWIPEWSARDHAAAMDRLGIATSLLSISSPGVYLGSDTTNTVELARAVNRSEEHTSELQSLMRISYAVFCLKKNNTNNLHTYYHTHIHIHNTYTTHRK